MLRLKVAPARIERAHSQAWLSLNTYPTSCYTELKQTDQSTEYIIQ